MSLPQASRYWPRMQVDGRVRLGPTFLEFEVHRFYRGKKGCRVRLQFRLEYGVRSSGIHANGAVRRQSVCEPCATRGIPEEFGVT